MPPRTDDTNGRSLSPRVATHQGDVRQAQGPDLSAYPGSTASDFQWDPETQTWAFNGQARPGMFYAPSPDNTKDHQTGWVPESDGTDPTGLFHGWTKAQLLALAGLGGAAVAGPLVGYLGGLGGGAGAAGAEGGAAAAGSAVPDLAVTSGLGAAIPGTAVGTGLGAGTLASTSLAGAGTLPTVAGAGNLAGGVGSAPSWLTALGKYGGLASKVGTVIGGQTAGTNAANVAQGGLNNSADRNAVDLYTAQQNAQNQAAGADLQRSQNRGKTAQQGLIGALLGGGVTPTSVSPTGASGGLLRSLNANPSALAALKTLGSQGSTAQQAPGAFTSPAPITPPTLTPVPQINAGDSGAGTVSKYLQILGAIAAGGK